MHCTAPHCTTLQHTATHCNTLHHIAPHVNTRQHLQHATPHCKHTTIHYNTLQHTTYLTEGFLTALMRCTTLQHTAPHCTTLQYTTIHCNTLQHTATTHCITLHHTTTHYNTLQLTATHLRIRLVPARFIKVDIVHINARDIHWMKFSKVSVRKFVCVCVYEFVCDIHEPRTIHITSCTWSWEADLYHLPKMKLEKQWLTFSKLYLAALDGPRALAAQESAHSQKVIVNPTP